jgi:hypothetical protein
VKTGDRKTGNRQTGDRKKSIVYFRCIPTINKYCILTQITEDCGVIQDLPSIVYIRGIPAMATNSLTQGIEECELLPALTSIVETGCMYIQIK